MASSRRKESMASMTLLSMYGEQKVLEAYGRVSERLCKSESHHSGRSSQLSHQINWSSIFNMLYAHLRSFIKRRSPPLIPLPKLCSTHSRHPCPYRNFIH